MTQPGEAEGLEELLAKATPGEWAVRLVPASREKSLPEVSVTSLDGIATICRVNGHAAPKAQANAALIVAAVNALPEHLRRIKALEDALQRAVCVGTFTDEHAEELNRELSRLSTTKAEKVKT